MGEKKITVITFNTLGIPFLTTHRHKNYFRISRNLLARFTYIANAFNTSDADVILLQEVHLYSLLRYLKRKLTNYPYVSYKKFLYGPKGGLVIFSKHKIIDEAYLSYSIHGSLRNKTFVTKIIQNGLLGCRIEGYPFHFINTYLAGNFSLQREEENKYTIIQKVQLNELSREVDKVRAHKVDVIMAGDLNVQVRTKLYNEFVSSNNFTDFFKDYSSYTLHPEFLPRKVEASRIDYIFTTSSFTRYNNVKTEELFTNEVLLSNGKKSFLSDHVALKASFSFIQKNP